MVAEVRGEEGVHACRSYVVEEAVAGAAAHRDPVDQGVGVARDADALRRGGQALGGSGREVADGQRVVQLADPAQAPAAFRIGRVRYERSYDPEVERAREGVGDSRVGAIGVGVGDVQRDVVLDQGVHHAALEGGGRDRGRTAQVEGVVGDQQVGAQLHRLVDDLLDRVHGEQHAGDVLVRVAHDGADRVPGLGPLGGPQVLQRGDDFGQAGYGLTGHGERLPGRTVRLNR